MLKSILFSVVMTVGVLGAACNKPSELPLAGHNSWEWMLSTYVDGSGVVNYSAWRGQLDALKEVVQRMGMQAPGDNASRAEKMAYWINLYNASTVLLIVDNYPVSSIMDLDKGKVWDRKWIKVGDKLLSLNNIENDILRPQFQDPRIHFAVNCAAKSCPPLWNHAWTAANLEKTLDERTRLFINHPAYNEISPSAIRISKIFEWYAKDFGHIIDYINKYSKVKVNNDATISYIPYQWALNGR